GDVLIGLRSSGLHTNGYSLVRRLFFELEKWTVDRHVDEFGRTLGEELLEPHRNYFPVLKELIVSDDLSGMAHITGGGITENLNRALPSHLSAEVERGSWEIPAVFRVIHELGGVATEEMYRTLNLGIGMILLVKKDRLSRVEDFLQRQTERYYIIGEIVEGDGDVRYR
ncbi:MAG TPA: AIR synthase-related protein, partial [Acidobacteriota bacterium]|nr:AIR synthase-related protein [Acidobacteriota bacterium]